MLELRKDHDMQISGTMHCDHHRHTEFSLINVKSIVMVIHSLTYMQVDRAAVIFTQQLILCMKSNRVKKFFELC